MAGKEKIYRQLDLRQNAQVKGLKITAKAASYSIVTTGFTDSGTTFVLTPVNSAHVLSMTLPPVNACNGHFWTFVMAGAAPFTVIGDTNVILTDLGSIKIVNFADAATNALSATFMSDGSRYLMFNHSLTNTRGFVQG